jgi:N-acetylglucosamine repressor
MKSRKATHGQLRRENRELILRAVYTKLANSRAELAQETGLAKPTVSDLISELIGEGYLIETGLGQSTGEGGKRPRLLRFVPDARHVIGLSLSADRVSGVLANLDGRVLVEHYQDLVGVRGQAFIDILGEVINGLIAQLDAPLLCLGVGVPGLVDIDAGLVRYAPHLDWQNVPLAETLNARYGVPAYVANSTELAALAQYAFGETNSANSLATVLVDDSIGVGLILNGAVVHTGSEIGQLRLARHDPVQRPFALGADLETRLGWSHVKARAEPLKKRYLKKGLPGDSLTYLHIRQAVAGGDPVAVALQEELAGYLAEIFAWVIALLRPDHISLAGSIADLGDPLLKCATQYTEQLVLPDLMRSVTFSLDNSSNLVALGAVAKTLQQELGLV